MDDGFIIIHQTAFVLCTSPVNILCNKHVVKWDIGSHVFLNEANSSKLMSTMIFKKMCNSSVTLETSGTSLID